MDILERMLIQNPWWEGKGVEAIRGMEKRDAFGKLKSFLQSKQIISITGLRRVGKTVLARQLIEGLLAEGEEPRKILYFSFDELLAADPDIIEAVLHTYSQHVLKEELKNVWVFFDEITLLPNWQVVLKRWYDLEQRIKFVVTGSSGINLKKAGESLAGRIFEFELKPLSFREFLRLRKKEVNGNLELRKLTLERELSRYLLVGGFPELVNEIDFGKAKLYVSSIADKIILSDIPKTGEVGNPEILRELFRILARMPGSMIEYKSLASSLKVTYQTVSKYMYYLEAAYLISAVYNKRGSPVATARKAKKAYLSAPALALLGVDTEHDHLSMLPALAENAVASHISAKHFWREYFELDFLVEDGAVEVKYTDRPNVENNIAAARKLGLGKLAVVTKGIEKKERKENIKVEYIPLWKFLLRDPRSL